VIVSRLLEAAVCKVEQTTEDLLAAGVSDIAALCHALEQRAAAIATLAGFAGPKSSEHFPAAIVQRIAITLDRGNEAVRSLMSERRHASDEWARLSRILSNIGLEQASPEVKLNL
jgi:hypothetical protein